MGRPKGPDTITWQARLRPELHRKLQELSAETDMSMNHWVNKFIAEQIDEALERVEEWR